MDNENQQDQAGDSVPIQQLIDEGFFMPVSEEDAIKGEISEPDSVTSRVVSKDDDDTFEYPVGPTIIQNEERTEVGVLRIRGIRGTGEDIKLFNFFIEFPSDYFSHEAFCDMLDQMVAKIKEDTK